MSSHNLKPSPSNLTPQAGITTIEILIAMVVIVFALSAVILVVFSNQSLSVDTQTNNEALRIAQRILNEKQVQATFDYDSVTDFNDTYDSGFYAGAFTVSDVSECFKELTERITWDTEGRPQFVDLNTFVSNPAVAIGLGGDCNTQPPPPGAWVECQVLTQVPLVPPANQGTDIDVAGVNGSRIVFLSSDHSSPSESDFWIYNVDDPSAPAFVASLDLGPRGAVALDVATDLDSNRTFAYILTDEDTNQLRVVEVTTLATPVEIAQVDLPNMSSATARSVYYFNKRVYVGTEQVAPDAPATNHEFHVFNMSDPSSPVPLGSLDVGHDINEIVVKESYAYLATSDNSGELTIIDVSNPASMTTSGQYNAAGNLDGSSLFVLGNKLYLGRYQGTGGNPPDDLFVLDISNPSSVALLGSQNLNHQNGSSLIDIVVSGNLAFIGSDSANKEFEVWDISDPQNIVIHCLDTNVVTQTAAGLDFLDNIVYGSIRSNSSLQIIHDPNN